MGRTIMSVIVLNVRTPLIDKNTCVGYINIAQDNLCEIVLVYLLFIYCLIFQVIFCLMLNSFHFTRQIQATYENVRLFVIELFQFYKVHMKSPLLLTNCKTASRLYWRIS